MRLAVAPLVLLAACSPYATQRTARVPHPTVPLDDGQPLDRKYAVSLGLSNAADFTDPEVGNAQQSVETPSLQLRGELRVRVEDRTQLVFAVERGLGNYKRADPTQPPVEHGSPAGGGFGFRYSIDTGVEGLSVGIAADLMVWSVPYAEYADGGGPVTFDTDTVLALGGGITPSYRVGNLTIFGGVYARNQPTVERAGAVGGLGEDDTDGVQSGPFNALVHAGLAYHFDRDFAVLADVHQDLVKDPVAFGPGAGFALQYEFGAPKPPALR